MKHVLHVVGARPNFMKIAPVHRALAGHVRQSLVHTGQHYDALMSDVFFEQLGLPAPDVNLGIGSASHAVQTGEVFIRLEPVLRDRRPDMVLVYGDVNSTMAAALVAVKLHVPVAHVEAGLRSRDRAMPEEINRIVTDAVADLLFTPSQDGNDNLEREGVPDGRVHLVGNVMIDTLIQLLPLTDPEAARRRYGVAGAYALVTLHRPSNVDDGTALSEIARALGDIARELEVLFPVHPRTRARLTEGSISVPSGVRLLDPLSYLEFLALQRAAALVITDSGGVQEETTFLNVPCITVRENTERPVTVTMGTNVLVGRDMERLRRHVAEILSGRARPASVPPLWDGCAGARIARILLS